MWVWPSMSPGITRSPAASTTVGATCVRAISSRGSHRDDGAVADGEPAVGQDRARGVHRDDDAVEHEQVGTDRRDGIAHRRELPPRACPGQRAGGEGRWDERLATSPVVTSAPTTSEGRPAMEYIGNDVHQRESQVRISDEEGGKCSWSAACAQGGAVRGAT